MTNVLFFACNHKDIEYLNNHQKPNMTYHFVDFDINSEKLKDYDQLADIDVISIFAHAQPIDNSQLDLFPKLKMISTRSTGFNHIDLEYCRKRNIVVSNVPNYGAVSVAEFTIGTMIALMRKIAFAKSQMKTNSVNLANYIGPSLKNKNVGIIGTGSIGRAVIKLLEPFGCHILAYDPYPSAILLKEGFKYTENIDDLYAQSDVISLHCPSTKENFHLLNKEAFSKMKKGVHIVNTARGSLIDTEALYEALKSGKVAGAALDVLENEDVLTEREFSTDREKKPDEFLLDSVINFKMLQLNNTLITPHIAFSSVDAIEQLLSVSLDNIEGFLNNTPQNVVS